MPATEVASVALKPGSNVGDPSNAAAVALKDVCGTIAQQDGVHEIHFGTLVEDPDVLQLFVGWESLDHHKKFQASETYGPFMKSLGSVVASAPVLYHAEFQPSGALVRTLAAPVSEVVHVVLEDGGPVNVEPFEQFRQAVLDANFEGFVDAAAGAVHEEVEVDGVKGKGLIVVLGWTSIDAHMKFRETETFKTNASVFRSGVKKVSMKHVPLLKYGGA